MNQSSHVSLLALAAIGLGLVGCANTRPVPYAGVQSSPHLEPNYSDPSGRIPYAYATAADWRRYTSVILEPVTIYEGSDHQFKKVPEAEKQVLAHYLHEQVDEQLRPHYRLVSASGPDTLRVKLTLTGANPTALVVGTFTRLDMAGLAYNLVQTARSEEGAFTGSASFAVEIYDSSTGQLLSAYVEKQYPNAMNILATFGKWDAAKTGLHKGAEDLATQLQARMVGYTRR